MYIIPIIRGSRALAACTLFPEHPILAITGSEIFSYSLPFINNNPINALNDMVLFMFYFYYYKNDAIDLMNKYVKLNYFNYILESCCLLLYILCIDTSFIHGITHV